MALTAGKQAFRMMLPPVEGGGGQSALRAAFRTQEGLSACGLQPVNLPQQEMREFVVCVASSDLELRLAAGEIAASMRLEDYDPENLPANTRSYVTHVDGLRPQDFPASPLPCCCFDIAVLPGDGFARLQARQLDALRCWVEAGGSVCLLPRNGLKGHHEQFLNDLAGGAAGRFLLDATGDIDAVEAPEGLVMLRPGLGRAVVLLPDAQDNLDLKSPSWRRVVAFLWKLRARQTDTFVDEGHWRVEEQAGRDPFGMYRAERSSYGASGQDFGHTALNSTAAMQHRLMPEGVRTVPAGILLLVFVGFVLAIGPVDYWLLGRLKKRPLTWLLFPVLSVGCAGLVVYLSEHYMGSQDSISAFVFVDVDRGGRVLRWSRCEMIYAGRGHDAQTRVQNALCAPLREVSTSYGRGWGYGGIDGSVPLYTGKLPFDFALTRRVSQWKPAFSRAISFEPPTMAGRLNWQAFRDGDVTTHRGRAQCAERLCGGAPFDGAVLYVHGDTASNILGSESTLDRRRAYDSEWPLRDFLARVSARPPEGVFSLVSQLSPGGPATLEDLSVLDPTDHRQRLLLVVERVGTDYYVYRCLFYGED
jgi:hypothetical protein